MKKFTFAEILVPPEPFDELVNYANEHFDGHFTVMKFTTNWRVGFGTPMDREDIEQMCEGKTFEEAAQRALDALERAKAEG